MTKERDEAIKHIENIIPYVGENIRDSLKMAIKDIEMVEEFEKAQIITAGRLNGRTYAYKCGLEAGKRKAFNSAMFIRGLYNGLRLCRPDYNADNYKWIIGKAVMNEFEEQNKYMLLPIHTATLYGIKVEVDHINRYDIKLYENITNKIDVEKDKNENRNEVIKMLTNIKKQACTLRNDTVICDVKLDSFNFVIDKAIERLESEE